MGIVCAVMVLGAVAPAAAAPAFRAPAPFSAGTHPFTIVAADFDLDGKPDLASANMGSSGSAGLTVLRNTTAAGAATPAFTGPAPVDTGSGPRVVAVLDVNTDGLPDLATANQATSGVGGLTVLMNTNVAGSGAITFSGPTGFDGGSGPTSVAAADFNGDGRPDLVDVTPSGVQPVHVLLNTTTAGAGTPSFGAGTTFAAGSTLLSVATPDVNRDGLPDIVTANVGSSGAQGVSILLNTTAAGAGTPNFAGPFQIVTPAAPKFVGVTDANGDGKLDLALAHSGGGASLLLNATPVAASQPAFSGPIELDAGEMPAAVTSGDINRDGKADLVYADSGASSFGNAQVLINTTDPGAELPSYSGPTAIGAGDAPASVAAVDVNADGSPDLAAANSNTTGAFGNTVNLNITPAALSVTPAGLAFGVQPLSTISTPRTVTLTNSTDARLPVRVAVGGAADDFLISRSSCGDGVPANGSCAVAVRFAPSAAGARAATLTLDPAGPQTTAIGMTGTGGALPQGPKGDTGATGPRGRPGRDAKVTCKVAKRKKGSRRIRVTCRVRLARRASAARWRLTRHGHTVARGRLRAHAQRVTLRRLSPGRYTLRISGRPALALRLAKSS
ncbi:MAG TPA: VCBS repeat-containing protein [Thermoleophilaceae bacterium]